MIAALALAILASDPLDAAAAKVVKLYGAGAGRVEAYGSGVLVGPDGKILTVLTGMLQGESITAVFADGRRRPAKLIAADPTAGLALLSAPGIKTPFFDLSAKRAPETGEVVYAVTNAFNVAAGDEPLSLQRGVVAGRAKLTGRVGVREAPTPDEVLLVDAAISNPGAAGGALVDAKGNLLGLVGRELRNASTQTWIHYAVPAASLAAFVEGSSSTRPSAPPAASTSQAKANLRGIVPLPDWLDRTPPFVDSVEPGSPADEAKMQADDLVMFVDDKLVASVLELQAAFAAAADKPIKLTVKRNNALITVALKGRGP